MQRAKKVETVFVTFGAGRTGWRRAARRLGREAIKTDLFKSVYVFDEQWLLANDIDIHDQIQSFRSSGKNKGFGYWAWKAAILKWAQSQHPLEQILYMDAGHHVSTRIGDRIRIQELLSNSLINNGLAWKLKGIKEEQYCKREVSEKIDINQRFLNDEQIQASFICMPPSAERDKFIKEFYCLAIEDNGFNFSDEIRVVQSTKFVAHRHDQSVFSLLWKKYEFGFQIDQTFPYLGNHFPILSTRNNTGLSSNAPNILIKAEKFLNLIIDKILNRR